MSSALSETLFAGREYHDHGDLRWVALQSHGNASVRMLAYLLRKVFRQSLSEATVDVESFRRALAEVPEGMPRVIVPIHRSYFDFLACSYLFYARPDLGIELPHIAAAEEFGRIPVVGGILRQARAFYIRRGVGKEDVQLTDQIEDLVKAGNTFEFFIEGTRSRSREYLSPKRGLLRCLQSTGAGFAVFPVAITYDRLPEEASFIEELTGAPKARMTLGGLWKWHRRLRRNELHLGRMHVRCGQLLQLTPKTDVPQLARDIVAELQRNTASSLFHLRSFLRANPLPGVTESWLANAVRVRGGLVISSPLDNDAQENIVSPVIERTLRYHWMHLFCAEALALLPNNPALLLFQASHQYVESPAVAAAPQADERVLHVLDALFAPICREYTAVFKAAAALAEDERVAKSDFLRRLREQQPELDLNGLENVLKAMLEEGLLSANEEGGIQRSAAPELLLSKAKQAGWRAQNMELAA